MCVVSVFQRCSQCWSFHGHIFWIFSPWRHFLKFYVLKVLFDTKSSSPAQNLNVSKSGICSIFELFNKIQRKSFAKRFTHKSEYIETIQKMFEVTLFHTRQRTLNPPVGKSFKYFSKIIHAIDVQSSPVVRSAEYVGFTGSHITFLLMFLKKRKQNFFGLCFVLLWLICNVASSAQAFLNFLSEKNMKLEGEKRKKMKWRGNWRRKKKRRKNMIRWKRVKVNICFKGGADFFDHFLL